MENSVTKALSGIEIALRESIIMSKQEDEFTVHDFITRSQANGQILSYDAADKRLRRMVEKKLLKFRLIPIDGNLTRVYSAY